MLSGLATYLFGSSEYDDNGDLIAETETSIQELDGEDWILVEVNQRSDNYYPNSGIHGQRRSSISNESPSCSTSLRLHREFVTDETSDVKLSLPLNNEQSEVNLAKHDERFETAHSTANEDDKSDLSNNVQGGDALNLATSSVINSDATNTATNFPSQKGKKKSSAAGTMEGSWFVTPPPCFINNHNTLTHKKVSVSPLEDILIEHPSISVFHSHSTIADSSASSLFVMGCSSTPANLPTTSTVTNGIDIDSTGPGPSGFVPVNSSSNANFKASSSSTSSASSSSASSPRKRSNKGIRQSPSSTNPTSSLSSSSSSSSNPSSPNQTNSNRVQRGDTRGSAPNYSVHQRPADRLSEINYVLAPMQKAYQARSQRYLKKSFMNRQNLVKQQSNQRPTRRNRMHSRPNGYSNNRKV